MPSILQRNQLAVFATTWLAYSILYFLRKPLGVIKPSLEKEFGVSKTDLGWLDVGLLLPYALVQIFSSQLSDRFGSRLTISLCLTIAGSAMFTFGMWESYGMLVFIMFINGAMQGPCWPACCKAVCAWYPDAKLNSIIGFMSTSVFVGGALGTALAVQLQSSYGWKMVHVPPGVAAVALGVLVYCVLYTPEEKHMSIPGKEVVVNSLQRIGEEPPPKKTMWQMWKIPAVFEISMTVLCLKVVRYCMFMWLPMYLVHYLNYSVAKAGLFSTVFDIGGSLGSPVIGMVLDRKFKKSTMLGMWIFVTISSVSMALFALTARWGVFYNAIFMFLAGATNGGTDSLLAGSVSMKIGEANGMKLGAAVTGLINGFGTLGAVVEGPLVGFISDNYGWDAMFTLMILLSAAASLMVFRAMTIQRRTERQINASNFEDKVPLIA
ncbi:unnamed protein product [Allacma fusca]|uniref:Major facilitator superfamily (MFS) profile domain-containing protein n=1 Tax=Allacma fusca TaxID=39272 RepID=A0A8J2LQ26_9HEXA|nr:unnamed protein product [Allacma fusca]